jgi:Fe2+ transport system protein FeoA
MPPARTAADGAANPAPGGAATRSLTDLTPGETGRLQGAELLEADRQLLSALGLVDHSRFRLCKAGNPWIVQVRGTRIGLADAVARRLQVVSEA